MAYTQHLTPAPDLRGSGLGSFHHHPPASSDDRITASLSASTLPSTVYWPPTSRGFRRQVRSSHCCAQSPIIQGKPNASSLRPGSLSPARPHPPPASLSHPQSSPVGLPVGGVLPQGLRSVLGGVFLGPGTHLPHCLLCAQLGSLINLFML